ncbi:MAG: prohibitin family protein [Alphaproteobacteria bacterium]
MAPRGTAGLKRRTKDDAAGPGIRHRSCGHLCVHGRQRGASTRSAPANAWSCCALGAVQAITGPDPLKVPFVDEIRRISTRVTFLEWTGGNAMEGYSRDQQPATLQVKLALRVLADDKSITELYTTYRDLANFSESIVKPRALEGIKTVFGQFNAVSVIQERAQFNIRVDQEVRRMVTGPVEIEGVQIQDISFSEAYEQSVEQRMQAQVEVERVQQNKAREQLQADIKVIQAPPTRRP